ncbi:hypothetical protein [Sinomonas soli]
MEADLHRFYGLDLDGMYAGRLRPRKVANLVENLPRGAAVWVHTGGPRAVSDETEALWAVEAAVAAGNWQRGGGKGTKPEMRPFPEGLLTVRARAEERAARTKAKAERFRRRHMT